MKKEQYTLRMLPIVKIALEKERQENGVKDLNNHINSILEKHITKTTKEENFKLFMDEKFKELEEKNRQLEEKIVTSFNLVNKLLTRIIAGVEK